MSSPVQLSDLDLATEALDVDLALIRKNDTTDYKITVALLRKIDIPGLPVLPNPVQPTDLMIVSQGGDNCQIPFSDVGFVGGTKAWFFQSTAPTGWTIVPNTGDHLLAVVGGSTYSTGGTAQGTWQQVNHALTIGEIPSHTHTITKTKENTGSSNNLGPRRGINVEDNADPAMRICTSNATGGGGGHNHGNTWRPLANVGLICEKS